MEKKAILRSEQTLNALYHEESVSWTGHYSIMSLARRLNVTDVKLAALLLYNPSSSSFRAFVTDFKESVSSCALLRPTHLLSFCSRGTCWELAFLGHLLKHHQLKSDGSNILLLLPPPPPQQQHICSNFLKDALPPLLTSVNNDIYSSCVPDRLLQPISKDCFSPFVCCHLQSKATQQHPFSTGSKSLFSIRPN